MTHNTGRDYLGPDEDEPYRSAKSRCFPTRAMYLAAVARTRWNHTKKQRFNGELRNWPFTKVEVANRRSRNRPTGTPVTNAMDSVVNVEYQKFFVEKLLPATKDK